MREALIDLNAECAAAIDDDRLEEWPSFFTPDCFYRITNKHNHDAALPAGLFYADSRQMLADRVLSLRRANVFESQRYRHFLGLPRLRSQEGSILNVETSFLVLRIVTGRAADLFASGRYLDEVSRDAQGVLKLHRRDVICDSSRVDTLLAIPL